MPANARGALDPRWTRHHTSSASDFMLADIRAYRKVIVDGPVTYDFETGVYDGATIEEVWSGKARIQPFGIIGDQIVAQDPTGRRLMRIQIKDMLTGIRVDDEIEVLASPDSPELVNFRMEVRGTIGSSNAWLTDLVVEANVKRYNDG